jgi:hypothetical protein
LSSVPSVEERGFDQTLVTPGVGRRRSLDRGRGVVPTDWCTRGVKSLDREDHRFILSSVLEDAPRRKAMVDASMDPGSWGRKRRC